MVWRSLALVASAIVVGLACLTSGATSSHAAELVMFDQKGCSYCRRWDAEVGVAYPKSAEGRRAPLRRIDIRAAKSSGLALAGPIRGTPTFVLVEHGREVGRIDGYPGADFFWGLLEQMLHKLPAQHGPAAGTRAARIN